MSKHRLSYYHGKATPLVCKSKKKVYPAMPSFDYYSYFCRLLDVPNSYSYRKGSLVVVNQIESGLEFLDPVGMVHHILRTNSDGTAFELVPMPSGGSGPISQGSINYSLYRTNEDIIGIARGKYSIDFQYKKLNSLNVAFADYSAILSGADNRNDGLKSVIGGGSNNYLGTAFIDGGTESLSGRSVIVGGYGNSMGNNHRLCIIGGGYANYIDVASGASQSYGCFIGGGSSNSMIPVSGTLDFLSHHVITGGYINNITGAQFGTICGGYDNRINYGAQGGANQCRSATIGGGESNRINYTGAYGCIPGGKGNEAGAYSFACGFNATAQFNGFTFADGTATTSSRNKQFTVGADGGFKLRNNSGTFEWVGTTGKWLSTPNIGCYLGSDGVWYSASSKDLKFNFNDVDTEDLMDKFFNLQVKSWEYKSTPGEKHIGVTSEEFYDVFKLGNDSPGINSLDIIGVLTKVLQGLMYEVEELKIQVQELKDMY